MNEYKNFLTLLEGLVQYTAREGILLPKDMRPSRYAFESLGFKFTEISGDSVLYQATLPEGWKIQVDDDSCYWTNIVDEKGRRRAQYFYKGAAYDRRGHMYLLTRFWYTFETIDTEDIIGPTRVVVKDGEQVIFTAGECQKYGSPKFYALIDKARAFLNEKYPGWDDPMKYWD